MLPIVDPVYSVAKGVFWPWLRWGLHWTIEGADNIPTDRAGGAREQPHLVSRSVDARVGGRSAGPARPVPRQGGAVRQAGARHVAPRRAPDSRAPRPGRRGRRARRPRSTRCTRGECVGVFPEGTISEDLEPMVAKSGTARLARRADVADHAGGPVGHASDPHEGPQAALAVGNPAGRGDRRADRAGPGRAREADDRPDDGGDRRLRRACPGAVSRPPARPTSVSGGGAIPRQRGRAPADRVTRVAVVGAGSWGTAVAAIVAGNAPTVLWARRDELAASIDIGSRESRLPAPASRFRTSCARPRISRPRARTPTWWSSQSRRTACAPVLADARPHVAADAAIVSLAKGIEQGSLAADDRSDRRGARRSRPESHRCAHRAESRARSCGRASPRRRWSRCPTRASPTSCSGCSSRRRCASTRTPTSWVARWRAR